MGCSFDINFQMTAVQIDWISGGNCDNLDVIPNATIDLSLVPNGRLVFPRGPFTIQRKTPLTCQLPEKIAIMKSAGSVNLSAFKLTFLAALFLVSTTLVNMLI